MVLNPEVLARVARDELELPRAHLGDVVYANEVDACFVAEQSTNPLDGWSEHFVDVTATIRNEGDFEMVRSSLADLEISQRGDIAKFADENHAGDCMP